MDAADSGLVAALSANYRLLREMSLRFGVDCGPESGDHSESPVIFGPDWIDRLLRPEMEHLVQEQMRLLMLDTRNRVIGQRVIYQGNVNSSLVRPAEVLRPAILAAAPNIIIAHNHPSGDPTPSGADVSITKDIAEAGSLLGIELLDHLVVGRPGMVSMKERGLMTRVTRQPNSEEHHEERPSDGRGTDAPQLPFLPTPNTVRRQDPDGAVGLHVQPPLL